MIAEFNSTLESIIDRINNGVFDDMLLAGDIEGVKNAVRDSL